MKISNHFEKYLPEIFDVRRFSKIVCLSRSSFRENYGGNFRVRQIEVNLL